jgi:hypothetical protein
MGTKVILPEISSNILEYGGLQTIWRAYKCNLDGGC